MVVGIDIDGTISTAPWFYAMLSEAVIRSGGRIIIVSARQNTPEIIEITERQLRTWGIVFTRLQLLPLLEEIQFPQTYPADDWRRTLFQKVHVCLMEGVDLFIDDDNDVLKMFRLHAPNIRLLRSIPSKGGDCVDPIGE